MAAVLAAVADADLIIAVAGETAFMSGEAASRADLHLVGCQEWFLKELSKQGKPMAVILVNGRPLAIRCLQDNPDIGAILEAWHLGTEFGNAIADILYGKYNPSGKLTVTFANEAGQEPMYYNHPNTGKPGGSFIFTSKYQDVPIEPLYPFGYGLSYTTFSYEALVVDTPQISKEDIFRCRVRIKNTGARFGEEVVQFYIRDVVASCARPVRELKGFQKIGLEPGEERICEFTIPVQSWGFHDAKCNYLVEPGEFKIYVGPDSRSGLEETVFVI